MNDKITCFKLNWYNNGLHCGEDTSREEITIYRNHHHLTVKELNGYGVICSCEIIHIKKDKVDDFFDFLEKICNEWTNDYRVAVCDGSAWTICMWHSSHKVKKIYGTIEYPPYGKSIEKHIRSFIACSKNTAAPKLFGCR